jgi:biotin transport system substrate-specific component
VRIPLPFTPVPLTGQVFAVLLAGVALGGFYGGLSQAIYVGAGAAGLPWFSGWSGGLAVLGGPTGGYLIGFILAAELIGRVSERRPGARGYLPQLGLMLAGVLIIYTCGVLHLALVLRFGFGTALLTGAVPFIGADLAKALLAAGLGTALLPKQQAP